jgi:hypothetical protein
MHKHLHGRTSLGSLIFFAILGLAPVGLACGGVGAEQREEGGADEAARDEAEIRRLSPAARMARLASLLRTKDVVKLPPLGVEQAANVFDTHVDLLPATSKPLSQILSERWTDDAPDVGAFGQMFYFEDEGDPNVVAALAAGVDADLEGNDKYAKIEFGRNDAEIKKFLFDVVAWGSKTEARSLLSGLDADYARLTVYDIGAEIVAVDVIAIRPNVPGARTLVLQLSYAHA